MTPFETVVSILDRSVGGPTAPVGFHGAFWRGITRDRLVASKIFGLQLIVLGDGAGSNLVKALKGEAPFGADLPNPPQGATYSRMPSGGAPVAGPEIAFIQQWIDDGCVEEAAPAPPQMRWRPTNAGRVVRTDDIAFIDPQTGWAVNSNGIVQKTTDGGATWVNQDQLAGYLRCIGFANASVGWIGTFNPNRKLYATVNGGTNWDPVEALPAEAPQIICGMSVVNERVAYFSGTNFPNRPAAMMKTVDGGATWTAWSMAAHASALIDTYFTDELNGWVVGGKSNDPNPTRDTVKPVVLRTRDGGVTWENRLAGQEADFPFGEWGWKIQFLDDRVGFIALENFHAAAILKTVDGGATWTRIPVVDPQGNANLEGIGFIDENTGWVGGWGNEHLGTGAPGFSSATVDGGKTWQNANEIGLFINRFRFFGSPVSVGYASGDTVYKYSAEPVPTPLPSPAFGPADPATPSLLPLPRMVAAGLSSAIPLDVPAGTARLTVQMWDRFGLDLGIVLEEFRPAAGARRFAWDGRDHVGAAVPDGDYIVRVVADDAVASGIVSYRASPPARNSRMTAAAPHAVSSVAVLMSAAPARDLDWLREALQFAIRLELATLPPYLAARWTIKNLQDPVAKSIYEIRREEMLHFGLACNLMAAIGGAPDIANAAVVPTYPGPLPGGVRPGLTVALRRLSREQLEIFKDIEFPEEGPVATAALRETFDSIGAFYAAIRAAFRDLAPSLDVARQLEQPSLGLFRIDTTAAVEAAVDVIVSQGEGSRQSAEERPGDLAHYYRFAEILAGRALAKDASGRWQFSGPPIAMPEVWPMADIPSGGYRREDVADATAWERIAGFDRAYSDMLRNLQDAWTHGDDGFLMTAIGDMARMGAIGRALVQMPISGRNETYGPCFRFVA